MTVTLISSDTLKMMKAKERMDLKKCFSCKNIKNSEAAKVKFYLIERTNKILQGNVNNSHKKGVVVCL